MKKVILTLNVLAVMALVSCKKEAPVPPPPPPVPQVVTPPPPPPPPAPVKPAQPEKDGTSISVGSDGVEISSKNGDKKTVIDVKDGKGKVEIKK